MPILVTDFDGTITRHDFYKLVIDELLPEGTPNFWGEYEQGRVTHFEALNLTFAAAPAGRARLEKLADEMEPDPDLAEALVRLREAGWRVIIVSAGSSWYIDRILARTGAEGLAEVHSSPGSIEDDRLVMHLPTTSRFFSRETGIDKPAVVREALASDPTVAFAGNGPPDVAPSLLVKPELRFARADLAATLRERGESFHAFERWSEVAEALLRRGTD